MYKPAPKGLPLCQSWLTIRNGVMNRVFEGLTRGGDPKVVALVGRSGSSKTTAAASFDDLWRGIHHPHGGETELQASVRSNRALLHSRMDSFDCTSVKGGGDADRLNSLMRTLAQKLNKEGFG